METFQQVTASKNVAMEKDFNFNAMMAITKMEMAALMTVKLSKDGVVQEDQVHLPVYVCWEILTELICNWQEQFIYMEESFKVWDFPTFLKPWLLTDVLNATTYFGSEWSDQTLSQESESIIFQHQDTNSWLNWNSMEHLRFHHSPLLYKSTLNMLNISTWKIWPKFKSKLLNQLC